MIQLYLPPLLILPILRWTLIVIIRNKCGNVNLKNNPPHITYIQPTLIGFDSDVDAFQRIQVTADRCRLINTQISNPQFPLLVCDKQMNEATQS